MTDCKSESTVDIAPPKRGKYRNVKTKGFDSRKEYLRCNELRCLEAVKEISDLQLQVRFELLPAQAGERPVHYKADFVYRNKKGELVVEDVKSEFTRSLPVYVLKRKLLLWRHGIRIKEV